MESTVNHITPTDWKFDINRLVRDVTSLLGNHSFNSNNPPNQISLTSRPSASVPIHDGVGSLYDFEKQEFFATESEFTVFNKEFKGTYLEHIYDTINAVDKLGRVRLMRLPPRRCYSLHRDTEVRYHMAITTNESCFIMYKGIPAYHIPADGIVYRMDASEYHTALNSDKSDDRIHLVFNSTSRIKR